MLPLWDEYITELIEAFSGDFSDPMLKLKQLKQTGFVREFQFAFDRLVAQCNLTVEQDSSCFLGGLKEELVNPIMMNEPKTLAKTCKLAMLDEATLAVNARIQKHISAGYSATRRSPFYNQSPKITHYPAVNYAPRLALLAANTVMVPRNRRNISPAEMQQKGLRGYATSVMRSILLATNATPPNNCLS